MPITVTKNTVRFVKHEFGVVNGLPYDYKISTEQIFPDSVIVRNANPNWRREIALGLDASRPYQRRSYTTLRPCTGLIRTARMSGGKPVDLTTHAQFIRNAIPNTPVDDTLRDIALARVKRKLSSNVKEFNSLVPLGEIRDLRTLVKGSAKLATSFVTDLLDIRKTKGKSAYKYAADAWLTFSFGISPMVSDASKLAESIAESVHGKDRALRISGTASKRWQSGGTYPAVFSTADGAAVDITAYVQHELSYRYTVGWDVNIQSANVYDGSLLSHFGFSLGSILPAAWELVPYSWVVDYFTTAGSYMEDVFTSPAGTSRYVTLSTKYTATCPQIPSVRPATGYNPPQRLVMSSFSGGQIDYVDFSRQVLSALPTRSLRFKTVDEIGGFAIAKLLNLTSLLVSRRA